jgi:ribosomal protein S18 acetylase RimI-like enzyme
MTRATHPASPREVTRAWAVLCDEGPRNLAYKLASAFGYRRLVLLERSLAEPIPEVSTRVPVHFEVLGEGGVDAYLAFRPDADREQLLERWRAGHACFAALVDERVASTCWVARRGAWSAYLGCAIELAPGDAYLFDAYTAPAHRGNGIAGALCVQQLRHLKDAGHRRAVRAATPENAVALRLHQRCGFRRSGMLVRVGVGPWQTIRRRA